ncbi:23478_t:CDS:2 [Cetraspora pellucida]|uniref:23478_t:CDS:1 n=1 Tax=Cetraspora pellucida TaxID=1433469 RepID=A0A9N9F8F1_9GLOM|nr:23478_t:CDS:2 [Cetraspora pellucida]
MSSTSERVYNETSTSELVYNETSTSERVYNEKYPGFKRLHDYLKQYKIKSLLSFLVNCRDMIIDTTSVTSNWRDLNNSWNTRFINEAQTLLNPEDFKNLRDKASSDQERHAKNLENYWNKVIYECNIKYDILEYKREKERVIRMLSEIEEKIKRKEEDLLKSSNEWKTLIKHKGSVGL